MEIIYFWTALIIRNVIRCHCMLYTVYTVNQAKGLHFIFKKPFAYNNIMLNDLKDYCVCVVPLDISQNHCFYYHLVLCIHSDLTNMLADPIGPLQCGVLLQWLLYCCKLLGLVYSLNGKLNEELCLICFCLRLFDLTAY